MTTIIPINAKKDSVELKTQSLIQFSDLSEKTDFRARKTLNQEFQPFNRKTLDADFPFYDAFSANSRIDQIAFPFSPSSSPTSSPEKRTSQQKRDFSHLEQIPRFTLGNSFNDLFDVTSPNPTSSILSIEENTSVLSPRKRTKSESSAAFFKKQHEALCNDTFKYNVTYLDQGSYSNVYTLEGNEDPIIPGVNNADLVLKAFHGEKSGFNENMLRKYLRNSITNYRAVIAAGLPVAKIYNVDTAEQDGYIIQQRISEQIDPQDAQQTLQVRRFFDTSIKKDLVMDLQPDNFALENGSVLLIDFVEEPDEIHLSHKQAIKTWLSWHQEDGVTQDDAANLVNELTANHYQEFVKEQLPRFFS